MAESSPALRDSMEEKVLRHQLGVVRQRAAEVPASGLPRGFGVLVGQQPNPATEGRPHRWILPDDSGLPHTANRLLGYSGLAPAQFLELFPVRSNACDLADEFDLHRARARVARLLAEVAQAAQESHGRARVVLLGREAWRCAAWVIELDPQVSPYAWHVGGLFVDLAYVPHTSGMTRAYNTPEQRQACRDFLQALHREVVGA